MKTKILITLTLLTLAGTSAAQSKDGKAPPSAKVEKTAPVEKPNVDIDSFFQDAEKQARTAKEKGHSSCLPKPIDETPSEPVT